jgi:hypothetical protein
MRVLAASKMNGIYGKLQPFPAIDALPPLLISGQPDMLRSDRQRSRTGHSMAYARIEVVDLHLSRCHRLQSFGVFRTISAGCPSAAGCSIAARYSGRPCRQH